MKVTKLRMGVALALGALAANTATAQEAAMLLPPDAKVGECYARVFAPPEYQEFTERVMVKEASTKLTATKPVYEWVEEKVLVQEAYTELKAIPAKLEWVEERVMVTDASEELKLRPAVYDTVEEQVLVRPAYTTWKKGRGLIERIDNATGEIMCRVEVPAEYDVIKKRVVKEPAKWTKVTVPAEYKTVRKKVVVSPARIEKVEMPAQYKTLRVKKVVNAAQVGEINVPAEYATVTKVKRVSEGHLDWRSVLCETNARPALVSDIQRALQRAGFKPGPIDGVIGQQTMDAAHAFQQSKGLASGSLTMETLAALGVSAR